MRLRALILGLVTTLLITLAPPPATALPVVSTGTLYYSWDNTSPVCGNPSFIPHTGVFVNQLGPASGGVPDGNDVFWVEFGVQDVAGPCGSNIGAHVLPDFVLPPGVEIVLNDPKNLPSIAGFKDGVTTEYSDKVVLSTGNFNNSYMAGVYDERQGKAIPMPYAAGGGAILFRIPLRTTRQLNGAVDAGNGGDMLYVVAQLAGGVPLKPVVKVPLFATAPSPGNPGNPGDPQNPGNPGGKTQLGAPATITLAKLKRGLPVTVSNTKEGQKLALKVSLGSKKLLAKTISATAGRMSTRLKLPKAALRRLKGKTLTVSVTSGGSSSSAKVKVR